MGSDGGLRNTNICGNIVMHRTLPAKTFGVSRAFFAAGSSSNDEMSHLYARAVAQGTGAMRPVCLDLGQPDSCVSTDPVPSPP